MSWRRKLLIALVALPLAYLALINLLLNSGLIPRMISDQPQALLVRWGSAWSPWPGRVYVRDFYLRFQDNERQWELAVDKATTRVAPAGLLDKTFQTRWVVATGVEFRFRHRLARKEGWEDLAVPLPPIEGLPDVLVPENPQEETLARGWAARLDGVNVEGVRELWMGPYRARVDGAVTEGRVWVHPGHMLQVGPAHLVLRSGTVVQAKTPVMSTLTGTVDCTMDIADLPKPKGAEVLEYTDARVDLRGQIVSLDALGYHLPFDFEGGAAKLEVDLAISKGRLLAGGHLALEGEELKAKLGDFRLLGKWTLGGGVQEVAGKALTTVDLSLRPVALTNSEGAKLLESEGLTARLSASDVLVGAMPADGAIAFQLRQSDAFPLRRLNAFVAGGSFEIEGGKATVGGELSLGPGSPQKGGTITLAARDVLAGIGTMKLKGNALFDIDLTRLRFARESANLAGSSLELREVTAMSAHSETAGWSGKIVLDSASVALRPSLKIDAAISGAFRDARPFLSLFGDEIGLPRWTTSLFAAENLRVSGKLAFQGTRLVLRDLSAKGDGLQILGQLEVLEKRVDGLFLVTARGVTVGLKLAGGKVQNQILGPEEWFKKELALAPK